MSILLWAFVWSAQVSGPGGGTAPTSSLPASAPLSSEITCPPAPEEVARLMSLPSNKFDQDPVGGWRPYAKRGCYNDAARLLSAYADKTTDVQTIGALRWHQFQMTALAGDVPVALAVLNEVKRIDALRHADEGWALYVKGTEAFLRRKPQELAKYIEDLSTFADRHGPTETVARLNNNVLKGFAKCIDSTYKAAYAPPCLDVQESRAIMQRQRNTSPIH